MLRQRCWLSTVEKIEINAISLELQLAQKSAMLCIEIAFAAV